MEYVPDEHVNILVVDDDANNRKYYLQVLKKNGFNADEAASGEEAVEYIAKNNYALVISDLQMYKLGGLDVLEAAKEKDPNTQVVIMTGYGSIPTAVKAIQQGAFDYMSKPVNKDTFLMRIQKALELRDMRLRLQEQKKRLDAFNVMIARDLELAKKVQASLVPANIKHEKIAVGIEYHPMIGIGGDFCRIHTDNDSRINLIMVDVTGHGISAALIVNRVYNQMSDILKNNPDPKDILAEINDFFYHTFGNMGLFLTIMSVQLDFSKNTMSYAGGAHPDALHFCAGTQTLKPLPSKNRIIGFEKSKRGAFVQEVEKFATGDKIIIYTDGVVEAEDSTQNEFGMAGLEKSLGAHIKKSVAKSCKAVIDDVRRYSNDSLRDDIMLMIVEIR